MNYVVLKNKYKVISMPKTTAKAFKDVKVGDIIDISLPLTWYRDGDNNALRAYYPLINGVEVNIPTLNRLIENGMVLKEE